MRKLPPIPKLSKNQFLFNTGSTLNLALVNILHFTLEFSVLNKVNLPYLFIIFHMIGATVGTLFAIKVVYRWDNIIVFLSISTLFIFFLISLIVLLQPIYTPIGLFGAGFCIGVNSGSTTINAFSSLPEGMDPKYNGRLMSTSMSISSLFVIIYAIMNISENYILTTIFFALILIVTIVSMLISKKDFQIMTQDHLNITNFFRNKKNLPKLGVAFFHGFFIINTYYAAILIFDLLGLVQYLNIFVLILFIIVFPLNFNGNPFR